MTLDWIELHQWRQPFIADNAEYLGTDFLKKYMAAGSPRIYEDNLSGYTDFFAQEVDDPLVVISERTRQRFHYVRTYHACAPTNTDSYYTLGILPLDAKVIQDEIRRVFLNGDYPRLTPDLVEQAIRETTSDLRHGRLFLALDGRTLFHCGHYMRYGSEYRVAIAATLTRLMGDQDYRLAFRDKGRPTIFVCDIPSITLCEEDWAALIVKMVIVSIESRVDPKYEHRPLDFTIELGCKVEHGWIVSHSHPTAVRDPLNRDLE